MNMGGTVEILDVYTKQIEMNTKLELLINQMPDHENRIRDIESKMPQRLSDRLVALEKWKYSLAATIVLSIVLTILTAGHVIVF